MAPRGSHGTGLITDAVHTDARLELGLIQLEQRQPVFESHADIRVDELLLTPEAYQTFVRAIQPWSSGRLDSGTDQQLAIGTEAAGSATGQWRSDASEVQYGRPEPDAMTAPQFTNAPAQESGNVSGNPPILDTQVRPAGFFEPKRRRPQEQDKQATESAEQTDSETGTEEDDSENSIVVDEISIKNLTEQIANQKKLLTDNESIDETLKTEQLNQLNSASAALQRAVAFQALIDERKSAQSKFQSTLADRQDKLAVPEKTELPNMESMSDDLLIQLQEKRQQLQEEKTKQSRTQDQIEQRNKRITELPGVRTAAVEQLKKVKQRLADLEQQPQDIASTLSLNAQELAAEKEIESLDIESAHQEQTGILLPLERDLVTRRVSILEEEIAAWETTYNRRREYEIAEQQRQAQEAVENAINADEVLRSLPKKTGNSRPSVVN